MIKIKLIVCFLLLLASFDGFGQTKHTFVKAQTKEVTIGNPEFIPYSRAFALLDGLFQDVSAIQVGQISLSANSPNATNLDAVMQQFQANLQFSQIAGVQNAATAQQSAAYSSSMLFEMQLIKQESELTNLVLPAQQQVSQAQAASDSLPMTATDEEKAFAKQKLTSATSNLSMLNSQIAIVKGMRASALSNPSSTSFTNPLPSPITLPSPMMSPSAPSAVSKDSFAVSFPPSKQMENQVNLLWERLANLLNTLAQSDNPGNIYLVKFNTGILVGKNKKKNPLLSTQYLLGCTPKAGAAIAAHDKPVVLDLFPRLAAVNIADQKYKDTRFGLGALLSFFSVGINASYNREHLRITQALGQSAYITGFGIQTDSFGWVFGPTLGEDIPASGARTTFALISLPEGCGKAEVKLVNAVWDKSPNAAAPTEQKEYQAAVVAPQMKYEKNLEDLLGIKCNTPAPGNCVNRILYTPVEYDPVNPGANPVTVDITLNVNLDREQTVSINGNILKRSRDSFGRATTSAAAVAGGLLQSSTLEAGSWFPVSDREMILTLNPALFSNQFPRIFLNSPKGSVDLTNQIAEADARIIGGRNYICPSDPNSSCASVLPAPGRPRPTTKRFTAARWERSPGHTHILFKLRDTTTPASSTTTSGALPPVQISKDVMNEPWSAQAKVIALQNNSAYALRCERLGEYLDCEAHDEPNNRKGNALKFEPKNPAEFEIFDNDYAGGSVKGTTSQQGCNNNCKDPLILGFDAPRWDDQTKDKWLFHLKLVNVENGWDAILGGVFSGKIKCNQTNRDIPCDVSVTLAKSDFSKITNSMTFEVKDTSGQVVGMNAPSIANLRVAVSPILSEIAEDKKHFTGRNLIWDEIKLDKNGRKIPLNCPNDQDCSIMPDFKTTDEGYLYFVAGGEYLPLLQLTEKGTVAVSPIRRKKPDENTKDTDAKPATLIQIENSLKQVLQVKPD